MERGWEGNCARKSACHNPRPGTHKKLFDNFWKLTYNSPRLESEILRFNRSSQIRPVRRQIRNLTRTTGVQEVLGSNPSAPTNSCLGHLNLPARVKIVDRTRKFSLLLVDAGQ